MSWRLVKSWYIFCTFVINYVENGEGEEESAFEFYVETD
jgi:hypothetical protein